MMVVCDTYDYDGNPVYYTIQNIQEKYDYFAHDQQLNQCRVHNLPK